MEKRRESAFLVEQAQRDALRFAEADADGNNSLDWDEFLTMQPTKIREAHSDAQIRGWFDAADADGDGSVSINEWFMWTLSRQSLHGPGALRKVFRHYDVDGAGTLDLAEFAKLADELGFGAAANDIFRELDLDGEGTLSYEEVLNRLMPPPSAQSSQPGAGSAAATTEETTPEATAATAAGAEFVESNSAVTKRFVMAIAWTAVEEHEARLDPEAKEKRLQERVAGWTLDKTNARELTEQMKQVMGKHCTTCSDLVELFRFDDAHDAEVDAGVAIREREFVRAMRTRLHYEGPAEVLHEVFELLGGGDDGKIDGDELFRFATGREKATTRKVVPVEELVRTNILTSCVPEGVIDQGDEWGVDNLRRALQEMLIKYQIGPHELLAAWDGDKSGNLSKREFLQRMKRLVIAPDGVTGCDLWYTAVRPTVKECFDSLAGDDRAVDVVEFSRFLHKRWPKGKWRAPSSRDATTPGPAAARTPGSSRGTPGANRARVGAPRGVGFGAAAPAPPPDGQKRRVGGEGGSLYQNVTASEPYYVAASEQLARQEDLLKGFRRELKITLSPEEEARAVARRKAARDKREAMWSRLSRPPPHMLLPKVVNPHHGRPDQAPMGGLKSSISLPVLPLGKYLESVYHTASAIRDEPHRVSPPRRVDPARLPKRGRGAMASPRDSDIIKGKLGVIERTYGLAGMVHSPRGGA